MITIIVPCGSNNHAKLFLKRNSNEIIMNSRFILSKNVDSNLFKDLDYEYEKAPGIYEAFNQAIASIKTKFYLPCGCDDVINDNLLEEIKKYDLAEITTGLVFNETTKTIMKPLGFIFYHLHKGLVSEHSVGMIVDKNLHSELGYYDEEKFHLAADSDFIMRAWKRNKKFKFINILFGNYSGQGTSAQKLSEGFAELQMIAKCNLNFFELNFGFAIRRTRELFR